MKLGLFVYGTLHPDRAPAEVRHLTRQFVSLGTGTVKGRLLDLGEYPGLVFDGELESVPGEVFAIPEGPEMLRALDEYEGFTEHKDAGSLFVRELRDVRMTHGGIERHWVYRYNRQSTPS
ncbi:gamma-glutamylcyclotransferase family protein [Terriglobus roseus]|uniref:Uncharacterized conserved protein YtfP, gamma-glutamylcyclotransferase (GGCT)/AIG2-like family n=1 Tax=Terriglobus roseus TaxID=392734 RepID=A0A1H4MGA4_9BACT|nr:gamma-glutamylcyclotransferase family protein [Terriglobus roseus]SEB82049.1 Uncharacterized conserved protein YtfP, gamma-glutamylcyclotransferase (GGCT)/AIG2-like family [Terriglobus roseus]